MSVCRGDTLCLSNAWQHLDPILLVEFCCNFPTHSLLLSVPLAAVLLTTTLPTLHLNELNFGTPRKAEVVRRVPALKLAAELYYHA